MKLISFNLIIILINNIELYNVEKQYIEFQCHLFEEFYLVKVDRTFI